MMNKPAISAHFENLSIEDLQKMKLREEILALKKPYWKQTQFISIVVTLTIAFTGTSITIWQKQAEKVEYAEKEKKRYQGMMNELLNEKSNLKERTQDANVRLQEALSEKAIAVSEKSEIKNSLNSMQEMQLIRREKELTARVRALQNMSEVLEKMHKGYQSGFIESFVSANKTVQHDINRFAKDGMKMEMEDWLKKQFLFTALRRYHEYITKQAQGSIFLPQE